MQLVGSRQGFLRTNLPGIAEYQSFCPAPLDTVLPLELDAEGVALLARCSRKIGEVEGMSRFLPNADMYLAMYVRKEALLSSQIEGTQCTFDDVLDPSYAASRTKDVVDVVNYVGAAELATKTMLEMPLCVRMLRAVHERLLSGVRGSDKHPGEVRVSQNWVGPAGCAIQDAAFVPPNVDDMQEALSDLDKFIHEPGVDPILKAALVHYQFETIHPFLDGNGRLGRLLITLVLMNEGVLSRPLFYPSYQLKLKRSEYYERLTQVRERGKYEAWVKFFCECMIASAQDAGQSLQKLVALHDGSVETIMGRMSRGSARGLALLQLLEAHPIVTVSMVRDGLGVSRTTAASLVNEFCKAGLLRKTNEAAERYRLYAYEDYLSILRTGGDPL